MLKSFRLILFAFFLVAPALVMAQTTANDIATTIFDDADGILFISADSTRAVSLRFRMQNRADFISESGSDLSIAEGGAYIKRFRLRSSGFLFTRRLSYSFQLGFTPGDMDVEDSEHPQLIRDAIVFYTLTPELKLGFGQTKLPGNRQRVISSGEQQFVDRSIVNATFNLDRDFGLQAIYKPGFFRIPVNLHGAISTGDGRNMEPIAGSGAAYTGRAEVLPFGEFHMDGDYFEGDWYGEPTPKLSVGVSYSTNQEAVRTGSTKGKMLFGTTDVSSFMADAIFKYRGIAAYGEYIKREADNGITINPQTNEIRYIYSGHGFNSQLSYQFPSHFEIAGRYSIITPKNNIEHLANEVTQYTLASTYYIKWHRIKLQSDLTYQTVERLPFPGSKTDNWILRLQVELGI